MIGTVLSFLISALVVFLPTKSTSLISPDLLSLLFVEISVIFALSALFAHIMSWAPLQKIEQNLIPRLIELIKNDRQIHYVTVWLFAFPLISIIVSAELCYFRYFPPTLGAAFWILIFGLSIDAVSHLIRHLLSFLNPFCIIDHIFTRAVESIQNDEDGELLQWIDALTEIAIKAMNRTLPSLAKQAINSLQKICSLYLDSAKSIAHNATQEKVGDLSVGDKVNYTLFYLYQQLELINEKSLEGKMEPLCSYIITTLGKVAIDSARFDITFTSYPLHYIGKFTKRAQNYNLDEVVERATCTLIEIGRTIIEEIDVRYLDLKETFFSIMQHLEEFAKQTFSRDKTVNIALLTQPFYELKQLFTTDKMAEHQDSKIILSDIDRIINQFDQLELVMKTIPPVELPQEVFEEENNKKT